MSVRAKGKSSYPSPASGCTDLSSSSSSSADGRWRPSPVASTWSPPSGKRIWSSRPVNTSWNVNQHYREREKKARRDIPGRSVAPISPRACRLRNSTRGVFGIHGSVTSCPSLAGPCTTRSELSGMTRAQARTKCPPGFFLPEIPLTLLEES